MQSIWGEKAELDMRGVIWCQRIYKKVAGNTGIGKMKKLASLVREISWSKNVIIIERCKEDIRREKGA
jgi:hypothetical protein